jgi:hypothetical protein
MWSIYYIWTVESFTIISYNDKYKINNTLINQKIFDRNILKLINAAVFTKENQEFKEEEEEYKTDTRDCILETGPWGQCDAVCDGKNKTVNGKKTRSVTVKQNPRNAGKQCDFISYPTEENCSITNCPVDCIGEWRSDQSQTDAALCNGNVTGTARKVTTETYHILKEADGGNACPNKEGDQKSQITDIKCDVNCQGKFDDNWGPCSAVCPAARNAPSAYGFKYKTFTVSREAKNNGINCTNRTGDVISEVCPEYNCPVDCVGHWGPCALCGESAQAYVVTTPSKNGGKECEQANGYRKPCFIKRCPYGGFPENQSFIIKVRNTNGKDYCLHPKDGGYNSGNGTEMHTWEDCGNSSENYDRIRFRALSNGQLQHVKSSRCITPKNKKWTSGSIVNLWDNCDDSGWKNKTLRYDLLADGKIQHSVSSEQYGESKNYLFVDDSNKTERTLALTSNPNQASQFNLWH